MVYVTFLCRWWTPATKYLYWQVGASQQAHDGLRSIFVQVVDTSHLVFILAGGASQQARDGLRSICLQVVDTSHLVFILAGGASVDSFTEDSHN